MRMATALLMLVALCATVSLAAGPPDETTPFPEDDDEDVSSTPIDYDETTTAPPDSIVTTTAAILGTTPPPGQVHRNVTPSRDSVKWADPPLNATTSSAVPIQKANSSVGSRASVFRVSPAGAVCLVCIVAIFCGWVLNAL